MRDRAGIASYREAGPVRRVVRQLVTTGPVARASARALPSLDRFVLRLSRGRTTAAALLTGLPVVQLTTSGARSGLPRIVSVLGIPGPDDALLVLGANFGSAVDPAWVHNVRAVPDVVVTRRGTSRRYRATELDGVEREDAFSRALLLNPGWTRFRARAAGRVIPVLSLRPDDGPPHVG